MPEKISIVKDTGETISSNIMSVFMIPETNKQYIITTENAVDPHGLTVLHVSEIDNDKLFKVRTDDEWASIKTIMRAIISASVGSYVYIPVINNANVSGQYSRDISVSAGAAKQLLDSYTNGKKEIPPAKVENTVAEGTAIESDSIFPTAPNENDQDNEIVPGIEEVDTSVNVEPVEVQPEQTEIAAVPDADNTLDTVTDAVSTQVATEQVATENNNSIDIPIIDENTVPASTPEESSGTIPQPYVDSPIVNEVVTSSIEPAAPVEQTTVDENIVPVVEGEVAPVDNVAPVAVESAPVVAPVEAVPGVQPVPEVSADITLPADSNVDATVPAIEAAPVVDNSLNIVPDVQSTEVPAVTSDITPAVETSEVPVDTTPVVPSTEEITPAPVSTEEVVPIETPAPETNVSDSNQGGTVVASNVTIDTEAITNSLNESVNESLKATITEEMGKIVVPSIEGTVKPAIETSVIPALEGTVKPAIESALSGIVDEKIKAPIEQKIEEVMNKVVEEKVQAPLMESVTKTVNDTIEKQSKALNSLGIKLDFGVESSFGKNASLDEIVAGSQELFVEGVKNLIMVMTERVYKELRVKEEELKRREVIVAQREQAVNDKTMAMLNGTYDPNAYATATPSVVPPVTPAVEQMPAPVPAPAAPVVPEVAAPVVPVETASVANAAVPAPQDVTPAVELVPAVEPAPAPAPGDAPAINLDIVPAVADTTEPTQQ